MLKKINKIVFGTYSLQKDYKKENTMSTKLKQDVSIGVNLQKLRQDAGLTQDEVAARLQVLGLSVSREIVSQMEQGKYSIRISVLLAMKELYKVSSMDDFFNGLL